MNAAPWLYAVSLPERTVRSISGLAGGVLRGVSHWALPVHVRDAALWRVTGGIAQRFLIEQLGDVRGIYSRKDPIAHELVRRYAVGASIEMLGIMNFYLSPVWVLAALGDATRLGRVLVSRAGNALKAEGLIDPRVRFRDMDHLLRGLEQTSSHLALTINMPPLHAKGLRAEWAQFRKNLAILHPAQLPSAVELKDSWARIENASQKVQRPVFSVSAALSLSAASAVPGQVQWLSRSAAAAARTTGSIVGRAFLDHYAAASKEMGEIGFTEYWNKHSRPYFVAAVRHFLPGQPSWTERTLRGGD
jgi:hypothetical protein